MDNKTAIEPAKVPGRDGTSRSRARPWLIAVAVLLVAGALAIHYGTSGTAVGAHDHSGAVPVEIGVARQRDITIAEHTIGTVLAASTVNVTAQVAGQVVRAGFREGQMVKKGQVLFELDPRPFQAALDQAKANLAHDSAQLAAAQNDQKRYATLFAQNAISAQQRDQSTAQAGALAASVQADAAAVAMAKLNLDYAQIRSPIDGKSGPMLIQPGNLVKANDSNALVVLTQIQPIKISFFLPQSDLPRIEAQMAHGALTVQIAAHGGGPAFTAPVDFVGNVVNNQTGTIELRANFANRDGRLVPGELVDVTASLDRLAHVMTVPSSAVNVGPDGHYVYTLDAHHTAHMVAVKVLYDDGIRTALTGHLSDGEPVITVGQLRVVPGEKVRITANADDGVSAAP